MVRIMLTPTQDLDSTSYPTSKSCETLNKIPATEKIFTKWVVPLHSALNTQSLTSQTLTHWHAQHWRMHTGHWIKSQPLRKYSQSEWYPDTQHYNILTIAHSALTYSTLDTHTHILTVFDFIYCTLVVFMVF